MIDYCHDSTEKGSTDYSKWTNIELFDALRDGGFCFESIQDELIERGLDPLTPSETLTRSLVGSV